MNYITDGQAMLLIFVIILVVVPFVLWLKNNTPKGG
jgi:hypothetical protein